MQNPTKERLKSPSLMLQVMSVEMYRLEDLSVVVTLIRMI